MTDTPARSRSALRRLDDRLFSRHRTEYQDLLAKELATEGTRILDVGCGQSSPLAAVTRTWTFSVGLDGHLTSLLTSASAGIHDAYAVADLRTLGDVFKPRSFDVVVALDVIEHLEKSDGYRLLHHMENLARATLIVFTPSGFLPQTPYDNNPFQEHLSGWTAAEMRREGFVVTGVNGWKPLRTERAAPSIRPYALTDRVSWLSQSLVRRRPERAFQLLCVKHLV